MATTKKAKAKSEPIEAVTTSPVIVDEQPAPEVVAETKAIATRKPKIKHEAALSIIPGVTTAELKLALDTQTEQRALIQKFIQDNLVVDIDYGKIHVVKNCQAEEKQRGSCDRDYHYSKSILFKPGQEKIFSLFGISDELEKDEEAYAMLQNVTGLVAYKCIMYRNDKKVGEGRGAATLSTNQNDPNSTIKKAEKRARMDACLSLGFSAYFTQDLDDPDYKSQRDMMLAKTEAEANRRDKDEFGLLPRDPDLPIDNSERATLHRILMKSGFDEQDEILELLKVNGITNPAAMTSGEARGMMGKLAHGMFAAPEMPKKPEDTVVTDIPDTIDLPTPTPEPAEPELVVDDDLKNHITLQADALGLNARGTMWLYQKISGRPFAKWDKLTDAEWRNAFTIVQGIIDGTYNVPAEYTNDESSEPVVDYTEPQRQTTLVEEDEPPGTPGDHPI